MTASRNFILASILVIFFHFVNSRKSPCLPSQKTTGISTRPVKRCVIPPNVKLPYTLLVSQSSDLELSWSTDETSDYYTNQQYLLQVKPNRRNRRSKTYCVRITVDRGDKLHKIIQLRCLKKFLGKNGRIVVIKESNSKHQAATVVKKIKYRFKKKKGKKRPTSKLSAPVTCYTWKPENLQTFISNNGVNITSCPRNISLGRMEFGLYNVKLDKMEPNFQTPKGCWAFFSNITDGEYTGTVQLRGCTDCQLYDYTRSPCLTVRHQSPRFTLTKPTTTLPPSTTPRPTCSSWKPTVRRFLVDGGVNVTACPRDPELGRLEFGLYHVQLEQMEKHFQTPQECWAFFPNISHGVYEGTVQLRDCTDCLMYSYTRSACITTRFHSHKFSVMKPDEPEALDMTEMSPLYHKLTPVPINYTAVIVASSCAAFALIVVVFVFVYLRIRGKKCDEKKTNEDQYRSLDPEGILVSPTNNNRILVLYQADDRNHLNAVQSFCKILRLCHKDVIMDREHVSQISEHNKEGWTRRQISECAAVIVVLSHGLVEKCQEMRRKTPPVIKSKLESDAFDDSFFNMSALGLVCIQNAVMFRQKTVIFVSFGYGLDSVKELSKLFPSMVKNVHSVTKELDSSPFYRSRTKRSLNLQTIESYLDIEHPVSLEAISRSEAANEFLFHVEKVLYRNDDIIMI